MAGATLGQTGGKYGPYDPRKKERQNYYKQVEKDLNKRFGKNKGAKKRLKPMYEQD